MVSLKHREAKDAVLSGTHTDTETGTLPYVRTVTLQALLQPPDYLLLSDFLLERKKSKQTLPSEQTPKVDQNNPVIGIENRRSLLQFISYTQAFF